METSAPFSSIADIAFTVPHQFQLWLEQLSERVLIPVFQAAVDDAEMFRAFLHDEYKAADAGSVKAAPIEGMHP